MLVRVENQNSHPFKQEFKGEMLSFAAKGKGKNFIDMEQDDAVQFVGMFFPPRYDGGGQPLPESFKMLDIKPYPGPQAYEEKREEVFACQACREEFKSKVELDAHIDANHLDQLADEKERETRQKRQRPGRRTEDAQ